jgi:hypothetical protein
MSKTSMAVAGAVTRFRVISLGRNRCNPRSAECQNYIGHGDASARG